MEGLEAPALVGVGDARALADHFVEQRAFGARPGGDLLPQVPVQTTEVVLHLAEVGQQLPGRADELLVPVPLADRIQGGELAPLRPGDLLVELGPAATQVHQWMLGILVGPEDHLAQQLEDRIEPGFGTHELPGAQVADPQEGLLDRRRQIKMGLVRSPLGIELAQPAPFGGGPIVEVGRGRPGVGALAQALVEGVESSSSSRASSVAGSCPALRSTNSRPRKLRISGALSARRRIHAGCRLRRSASSSWSSVMTSSVDRVGWPWTWNSRRSYGFAVTRWSSRRVSFAAFTGCPSEQD